VHDEIRRDPEAEAAFRDGLNEPLSGDAPTIVEYADSAYPEERGAVAAE